MSAVVVGSDYSRPDVAELVRPIVMIAVLNGLYTRMAISVHETGVAWSLFSTFNISLVIWVSVLVSAKKLQEIRLGPSSNLDIAILGGCALLILLPVSGLSWIAISIIAVFILSRTSTDAPARSVAWLLLGLSFSAQWSRYVFKFFLDYILRIDALLVGTVTGLRTSDNLVYAADNLTTLKVIEGCSSFANVSLALLGWFVARTFYGTHGWSRGLLFCTVSGMSVVAINTLRIAMIAMYPQCYDLLHGPVGLNFTNLATTIAIVAVSMRGASR